MKAQSIQPIQRQTQYSGNADYGLSPQQMANFKQMAATLLASGQLSARIKRPEDAVVIMAKGIEVGLPPMEALKQIYCIGGIAAMQSDGMRSLLLRSGVVQIIDAEHTKQKAVVRMVRKDKPGGDIIADYTATWTIEKAQEAGLNNKPGPWKQYPDIMLRHRATGEAARAVAADIIGGMYVPEDFNVTRLDDITPEIVAAMEQEPGVGVERIKEIAARAETLGLFDKVKQDISDTLLFVNKSKSQDLTEEELHPIILMLDGVEKKQTGQQETLEGEISPVDDEPEVTPAGTLFEPD